MKVGDGASFIGLFASFPVEKSIRRVEILKTILDIEDERKFKRIKVGRLRGKIDVFAFSEERLRKALQSLETGETDFLQLVPYRIGEDWVQSYKTSVGIDWESAVIQPHNRPASPIDTRFGSAGNIIVQYPLSRFVFDLESTFQKKLLQVMKTIFVGKQMHWAFLHKGFHFKTPTSIGTDDLFQETKEGFPLTGFDADLSHPAGLFHEYVKGAFWANFLNPLHVEKLGGMDRLIAEKPCKIVEAIGEGRILLQVGPSPLTIDESESVEAYQKLRRFLKPISVETGEDRMRIQREVLGSWKPPSSAEQNWAELLTETRERGY